MLLWMFTHKCLFKSVFTSVGSTPRSGIAGPDDDFMCSSLRNLQTVFLWLLCSFRELPGTEVITVMLHETSGKAVHKPCPNSP